MRRVCHHFSFLVTRASRPYTSGPRRGQGGWLHLLRDGNTEAPLHNPPPPAHPRSPSEDLGLARMEPLENNACIL